MPTLAEQPLPFHDDLFGHDPACPDGLHYRPNFLSTQEEEALLALVQTMPLAPFQFGAFKGKRRTASFGRRYDYSEKRLRRAEPLPEFIRPFVSRAESRAGLAAGAIAQALFTEYAVGAGIGWHRDKATFESVLGISLGSACPLRFRRKGGKAWRRFTLHAAPRSLYLMQGEARFVWEHSIAPVALPRWSITFRTLAA